MPFARQAGGIVHPEHRRQGLPSALSLPAVDLACAYGGLSPVPLGKEGAPEAAPFMDSARVRDGLLPLPVEKSPLGSCADTRCAWIRPSLAGAFRPCLAAKRQSRGHA